MVKFKRFITVLIFLLFTGFIGTNYVLAAEDTNLENNIEANGVSELFSNFIDKAFSDVDELLVLDSKGLDITDEFIGVASVHYNASNYQKIQDIIKNQDLSISHGKSSYMDDAEVNEYIDNTEINKDISGNNDLSFVLGKNDSREFYHIATDTTGRFTKEWVVTLSGSYLYDTILRRSYGVQGPTVNLTTANFGASFSPYMENITTSDSTSNSVVTFSANYTMMADLSIPIGDIPIGVSFDFGSYNDTFQSFPVQ